MLEEAIENFKTLRAMLTEREDLIVPDLKCL